MQIWDRQRCKSSGQGLKVLLLLTVPPGLSRGLPHATGCQREPRRGTWSCELLRAGDSCRPGKKAERQAPKCEGKQIHGRFVPKGTKASLETVLSWLITENHSLGTSALLQLRDKNGQNSWEVKRQQVLSLGDIPGVKVQLDPTFLWESSSRMGGALPALRLYLQRWGRCSWRHSWAFCNHSLRRNLILGISEGTLEPEENQSQWRELQGEKLFLWIAAEQAGHTGWVPSQVRRKTGMARMFIHQRVNALCCFLGDLCEFASPHDGYQ